MLIRTVKVKKKAKTTVKYAFNSLAATAADFLVFFTLTQYDRVETVTATFLGNLMGAAVSFTLLQNWVFKHASEQKMRKKLSKFALGVGICTVSNMILVAALFYLFGWTAWPARITAALGAWLLGFWFNRKVVFKYYV